MARAVHELIRCSARRSGAAPAVTSGETTLSYAELWAGVQSVAAGLAANNVSRSDRVAVYLDKRPETVMAIFGTSLAGGVFVPMNPVLKPKQVGHILRDCSVRVLITSAERRASLLEELDQCPELETVVVVPGRTAGGSGALGKSGLLSWADLVANRAPLDRGPSVDSDVAAIFYTSGSTGLAKGVVLTHRNIIVGAESVSEYLRNVSDDVILAVLPLSFDAGFSQLTTAFHVGAHVVLMNYLFPADVVRLCARHRVTGLTCVPPLWIQLASTEWPVEGTRALRYFANTGGRMPKSTLTQLRHIFPQADPYLMYGLTEAFRSTYLDPSQVDSRPDSIGKAIPNAEILVARPDGTICQVDEPGELVHRGPLVALGYWNDSVRTAERFRPAPGQPSGLPSSEYAVWSGDSVVRDAEGYLYFVGRQDEMIKTSGYRVSPTEVEEAAYDTGLVRDAVALGVEDEIIGQEIVIAAVPAVEGVTVGQVAAALRQRLPLFMVPRRVVLVAELPHSPNGKFDRKAVRGLVAL